MVPFWWVVVAAIGSSAITLWVRRQNDKSDRRNRTAPILGRARHLIDNLGPDVWALNASDKSQGIYDLASVDWRAIRPELISLRAHFPQSVSDVEELATTIDSLMVEIGNVVSEVLSGGDALMDWRARAISSQSNARNLANRLLAYAS